MEININHEATQAAILIIDDEEVIRESLSERVERVGHRVQSASTLQMGLKLLDKESFDLVFLDINLPDGNGLEALPEIRKTPSNPEVIIITALGSSQGAAMAIENGAWDYITKPFDKDEIVLHIERSIEYRRAKKEQPRAVVIDAAGIIGQSNAIRECLNQVAQCAACDAGVLILGETGTGKELFARAIHDNSHVRSGDYVVVDCAAMPETLMESVLFGYVKGAFTGADKPSEGLIKKAEGGTLFLDEVGELPLSMQKTLLRVLQEKRFRPVGSSKEVSSDFRLISATNKNLARMVEEGTFREDLYHRLKTMSIILPSLRERKEDIELIAQHYIPRLCAKHFLQSKALLAETLTLLESYRWPGNVRELVNALEKAILTEPNFEVLYPMFVPKEIRIDVAGSKLDCEPLPASSGEAGSPVLQSFLSKLYTLESIPELKDFREQAVSELESLYLKSVLSHTDGNINKTIEVSGLSKSRLYSKISTYNLKKKSV